MAHEAPAHDESLILERVYIEGWVLALTFGTEEEFRAGNVVPGSLCLAISVLMQIIVFKWRPIRTRIGPRFEASASRWVRSFPFWVVTLFLFCLVFMLSPYVEQRRWPYLQAPSDQQTQPPPPQRGNEPASTEPVPKAIQDISKLRLSQQEKLNEWLKNADTTIDSLNLYITKSRDIGNISRMLRQGALVQKGSDPASRYQILITKILELPSVEPATSLCEGNQDFWEQTEFVVKNCSLDPLKGVQHDLNEWRLILVWLKYSSQDPPFDFPMRLFFDKFLSDIDILSAWRTESLQRIKVMQDSITQHH